ncbi:hypothetical protein, partial [Cylindrospermopsis raciborskii]
YFQNSDRPFLKTFTVGWVEERNPTNPTVKTPLLIMGSLVLLSKQRSPIFKNIYLNVKPHY